MHEKRQLDLLLGCASRVPNHPLRQIVLIGLPALQEFIRKPQRRRFTEWRFNFHNLPPLSADQVTAFVRQGIGRF